MKFKPGDIISYIDMCQEEGTSLQKGMNFRLRSGSSVILMSVRAGAPYSDRVEEDGRVLIHEGHDLPKNKEKPDPKCWDQPMSSANGTLTENGRFYEAAKAANQGMACHVVKVYEKIRAGIWVFNGFFELKDSWLESSDKRKVFKFRFEVLDNEEQHQSNPSQPHDLPHNRLIPTSVKLEVWKRDHGRCVVCASENNLHFDHVLPFSKGGSSLVVANIQLLCARHNLQKSDKIV